MDRPAPFASVRISGEEPGRPPSPGSTESHALGQADRLAAVGQLAGGLAHEMNTPLGSISAHAEESLELLRDRRLSEEHLDGLRGHVLAIMRQAHRCSRIASRLLQFARPARAASETGDVGQVVRDVIDFLTPAARARGVALDHELDLRLPAVPVGPAELEQLLYNLVQNAMDACRGGDVVRARARAEEGRLRLVVEDTGGGIAREDLGRIFDPFFTTKPVGQGTGLGLSVCHGIVVGAGGSIEVASAPGCGALVTVDLPTAPAPPPAGRGDPAQPDEAPARRGSSGWQGKLLGSYRRTHFLPTALLGLSLSLPAAPGCPAAGPRDSAAATIDGPGASPFAAQSAPGIDAPARVVAAS